MPSTTAARTFVYVDGFNLYYRALKGTRYKWLDLSKLAESLLGPNNSVDAVRYYSARISSQRGGGQQDHEAPKRQHAYLKALQAIPGVSIHYGRFLPKQITRPLVGLTSGPPQFVKVHDSEEKGSDVNLASHLLWDGWRDLYDVAVVISKDTDLVEPIRIVTQELRKPVGLICPDNQVPGGLKRVVSFVRFITHPRLARAQMPNPVATSKGELVFRPKEWATGG